MPEQADRLIDLGVHGIAGISATKLRAAAGDRSDALLVIHPNRASASALAPLLTRHGKSGFVVVDMPDVDRFSAIEEVSLPDSPIYSLRDVERGDSMANWSPDEALPAPCWRCWSQVTPGSDTGSKMFSGLPERRR